ncbi:MAG: hypothetical protein IJV06_00405 [Bacteroidaceae bacterium]|nr:hypothetical protein [Bacteroidaceae bacterium]
MKKLLLSLVAVLATSATFAYEVDEYIYTANGKFKVISTDGVDALNTWNGADDVDVWSTYAGDDATDNCLESLDGSEDAQLLYTNAPLTYGSTYVVTLKIKGVAEATSSIAAGGQNQINAFVTSGAASADGVLSGTANQDYVQVASTATILNGEWTEISFSYENADTVLADGTRYLNIVLGRLTTGTVVADAQVCEVVSVFDTRITDKRIDFITKLLADENFSAGNSADVEELLEVYEMYLEDGTAESQAEMEDFTNQLNDAFTQYLDESSTDLSGEFRYIDIFSMGRYNRGNISEGQIIGGFKFTGDNWLHSWGKNANGNYDASLSSYYLTKQIQGGGSYSNGEGTVALYNETLPAGRYYISAEMRNANCDKNYNLTYTLEKSVKAFIGTDTVELGTIIGEDFQRFYYIADLKEGETFDAGFWWEGTPGGSAFHIQGFEIRSINVEGEETVQDKIERTKVVNAFLEQWNAATSQRNALLQKQADKDTYPWEQDSIQTALNNWDPYYQKVLADGWVDAEGNVAGKSVVSNDELTEWTKYQGVELYNEEGTRLEFQLVRNFQWTNNFVEAQNKPVADLKAAIAEAKAIKANPDFASGDFSDLDAILEEAEELVANISSTNQGDEFDAAREALADAMKEFLDNFSSFKYPLALNVVNGNFQDVSGRSKSSDGYRSHGGQVDEWNGWTYYSNNESEYFRINDAGKNAEGQNLFEGIFRAGMWRGWTGNPCGSVTQEITVTKAGMYVFNCQAYAIGDGDAKKILAGVRKINIETEMQPVYDEENDEWYEDEVEISRDTTYMSGVNLIFGSATAESIDSLEIWTQGEGDSGNYTPQSFTMYYDKKTDGEEVLKFGLDGFQISAYVAAGVYTYGPNAYGIGSVTVQYGGSTDKYLEDLEKWKENQNKVTVEDITKLIERYLNGEEGVNIQTVTELIDRYLAQ